jgi:hypothetical protein
VSRLEVIAKGLVVDGDVEVNDLGDNFETKADEYSSEPNTGYSVHTTNDARNHERPNHLRLFQEGWEPRSFHDRDEDDEHIARVRDMERRNKQATQEFLGRWNEAEGRPRGAQEADRDGLKIFSQKVEESAPPTAIRIRRRCDTYDCRRNNWWLTTGSDSAFCFARGSMQPNSPSR